jgi:hypothetical protein
VGVVPGLFSQAATAQLGTVIRAIGYPLVIVDCPPILTSAETLLFSRVADDRLLTVRSGTTRERDVKQALELLQRNGTPATGIVLNDYKDALGGLRPPAAVVSTAPAEVPARQNDVAGFQDAAVPMPAGQISS